jgi:hypothetical protein
MCIASRRFEEMRQQARRAAANMKEKGRNSKEQREV